MVKNIRCWLETVFLIIWCCFLSVHGQCSGTTLTLTAPTNRFLYFTSPNHPSNYENYQTCIYQIDSGGTDRKAAISFLEFNIERNYDYFRVYDGTSSNDPSLGTQSGTITNGFYISTGQYMYITFSSDFSVTMSGFKIQYFSVLDAINKPACGNIVTVNTATVGLEEQYALSSFSNALDTSYLQNCEWTISAPSTGDQFVVTIVYVDVNSAHENYVCDIASGNGLSIYTGSTFQYQTCQISYSEVPVYGDGSQTMSLKFKAPAINNIDRGFLITIKYTGTTAPVLTVSVTTPPSIISSCGSSSNPTRLTSSTITQYVASPNYPSPYSNNLNCWYTITSSSTGTSVKLSPTQINTATNDYVYVYDGPSSSYVQLASYTGDISLGTDLVSSGSSLTIQFSTDGSSTNTGFSFSYIDTTPVIPSCVPSGYVNITADTTTQFLDSHAGFGTTNYANNLDSYWLVWKPSESDTLYAKFTTFRIESHTSCTYDYLKVYNGPCVDSSNQILNLCGEYSYDYTYEHTNGKYVLVYFHTDGSVTYKGWRVAYSTSDIIDDSSDDDSNTRWIILGVILGVLFIIIVSVSICAYRNSRRVKTVPVKKVPDMKTVPKPTAGKKFNPSSIVIAPSKQKVRPVREPKRSNKELDSDTETEPPSFTDSRPIPPLQPPNQTVHPQQRQYPPPPQPPPNQYVQPNMYTYPPPMPQNQMGNIHPSPYPPPAQNIPGPFTYTLPPQLQ